MIATASLRWHEVRASRTKAVLNRLGKRVHSMAKLLGNLSYAVLLGTALLLVVLFGFHGGLVSADGYANGFFRFLHVLCGIMWIGLLYYFNFVQIPTMPKVPAELKPAVSKYIAPEALF